MKRIVVFIAAAAILSAPGLRAQSSSPVVLDKTASGPNPDGTYTLTLKSYVTGKVYSEEVGVPADIVFVMDFSGSMNSSLSDEKLYAQIFMPMVATNKAIKKTDITMTPTSKDAAKAVNKPGTVATKAMKATDRSNATTKDWTFNGVTANANGTANFSHFYRDTNGDYFVVHKANDLVNSDTGNNDVRALWYVDKNGNTKYLTAGGVSDTYEDITSNTATIWNGTLYKGWTYTTSGTSCYGLDNGNETGNVATQWYYLHTDGNYYPVRRAANLSDGNGNNNVRAAWVVIDGTTYYLHGEKLDPDGYDKTIKNQYQAIWFGPLYKGGWTPANITAGTATDGHYYQTADGKRYPVQKATEQVDGVNTTQVFVEIPGVGKRYLNSSGLSVNPCPYTTGTNIPFYFGDLYTGGWKTSNITDGTTGTSHYYLHTDNVYYPVREIAVSGNHQAYVELPEGKFYFDGNGLASTPDTPYSFSTTNQVTLYFGTLYTMTGWTQGAVKDATTGSGHYYLYDGKYYPVMKETLENPTTYQLYVEIPGGKRYLWGHELQTSPCPYSATTTTVMWYGTLYKGGWTYNTITENTHFYKHSDGEYYPVKKLKEGDTFQVFAMIPNASGTLEKKYIWGHGAHDNPCSYSLTATVNIFFEPLYTGGWTYNNITQGTAANGCFYLHSDKKYYPVLKQQEGDLYQAYVILPEGKRYLYGSHISQNPYPYATTNTMLLYTGSLYKGGWTYSNIKNGTASSGHFYKHTDGEYYPVKRTTMTLSYDGTNKTTYQVYVDLPEPYGRVYLAGSDISSDPYLYAHAEGSSIYFHELYQLKGYTKYEGLKNAVLAFIEELSSKSGDVPHRIALSQFAFSGWGDAGGNRDRNYPHLKTISSATAGGYSALLADLMDISDPEQRQNLINTMATPPTIGSGHTVHAWGLSIANGLLKREAGDDSVDYDGNNNIDDYEKATLTGEARQKYGERPKIVIVIGDGEETDNKNWGIEQANKIKSENENVTVFFVHVSSKAINDFEKAIATDADHVYKVDYYDEELIETLLKISQVIGGAAIKLDERSVVQDVVKPEFTVPDGAEILMFTANCIDGPDDNLTFEEEANWETFNGSYTLVVNPDKTTTLRVTGFDFSENWCGDHGTDEGYKGKQLIIQFPILPKDGIVGGKIPTNTPDSQIIDGDGKPVLPYPIPFVGPFPIRIQIVKSGLQEGESAVFFIWRKLKGAETFNKTGQPYMKVVLTGTEDGTAAEAVIENLDPDYSYLIEESTWSWKYTPSPLSISTEEQSMNPYEFKNTLKDISTKNGEAKAKNEFF